MAKKKKEEVPVIEKHPFLSASDNDFSMDQQKARDYFKSDKFNPKEAQDLLAGKYGHLESEAQYPHFELNDELRDNPHVTDEVKSNIFNHLHQRLVTAQGEEQTKQRGESEDDSHERVAKPLGKANRHLKTHIKTFGANKEQIEKLLSDPYFVNDTDAMEGLKSVIQDNKKIEPDAIVSILKNEKASELHTAALHHENAPEKDARKYISKAIKEGNRTDAITLASHKHADPSDKKNAIEGLYGRTHSGGTRFITALNGLPDEEKEKHVNHLIGIEDGHKRDEDIEDPDQDFDNWRHGKNYNEGAADDLAEHGKMSDAQIEHLMRHGTEDQKIGLFHNPNLKPEHYEKIYEKFENDDSSHGYDLDKLKEKIKEDNEESIQESVSDEAREAAEENNPLSEYIDNMSSSDIINANDSAHTRHSGRNSGAAGRANPFKHSDEFRSDLAQEAMDGNDWESGHDWKGENPNYDKDEPEHEKDNPKEIDFSDHPNHSIQDHPEYESRNEDAVTDANDDVDSGDIADKIKEHWNDNENPDDLYEGYDESLQQSRWEHEHTLMKERMSDVLIDKDLLPDHIKENVPAIRDAAQLAQQRKDQERLAAIAEKDKRAKTFLDPAIPNRPENHEYGPGLHHHEMVKDYADANGGAIDIGAMNKIHPNLKDKWKEVFGDKGKVSSQEVQQKMEALPKSKYNITYGHWDKNNMQNTNGQHEAVVRLDHSDDSMKELDADPETRRVFDKINEAAQRSGHPSNPKTIAWMRLDPSDKKHWFMDELQSDFESSARDYLDKNGHTEEAKHIDKINTIHKNWRENLMNHVIKMAKANGVEKLSTHSGESKAAHTGSDKVHSVYENSYKKVPRQLGFKASEMEHLPLNEEGQKVFKKALTSGDAGDRFEKHVTAMQDHAAMAKTHDSLSGSTLAEGNRNLSERHDKMNDHHLDLSRLHKEMAQQIDPSHKLPKNYNPRSEGPAHLKNIKGFGEYRNEDLTNKAAADHASVNEPVEHEHDDLLHEAVKPVKPHQGHTLMLAAPSLKKAIEFAEALIKMENLLLDVRSRLSMR